MASGFDANITMSKTTITLAHGDGIGPEIMGATRRILDAAGAALDYETIEVGEKVYLAGHSTGISPESWQTLFRNKVLLKGPITTPQGGGYKSLNVAMRKGLGLFANVRPCTAYHPFVATKHPTMDLTIIRENEEDLYAGIEHRHTDDVVQCLKLISRQGCERIVRYAFEYARRNGRKKVTCMMKDNIMKMTDGLFHKMFDEIGEEYPDLIKDSLIVDIGAARLADTPEIFEVIVTENLYGDILSDLAAQISGSVGLGGSANIGSEAAMFEAIHGSAPNIAGQGIANPSGLLLGAIMMLVHVGQPTVAERIHNAWLCTLEDGIHTGDIYKDGLSKKRVGTQGFGDAVIERLGKTPHTMKPIDYAEDGAASKRISIVLKERPPAKKVGVGVDVFLHYRGTPESLGPEVKKVEGDGLTLQMISNRGIKVYPDGLPGLFCVDHWRCRFMGAKGSPISHKQVISLLQRLDQAGFDFVKSEGLYEFDGQIGFTVGAGG